MLDSEQEQLPIFLQNYGNLADHLDVQLQNLDTVKKGTAFATFVTHIAELSELGINVKGLQLSEKKSRDSGVDIVSQEGNVFGQSKLRIKDANEFAGVVSEFENYYTSVFLTKQPPAVQLDLFNSSTNSENRSNNSPLSEPIFFIATLSNIKERIIPSFEKSSRSSVKFYKSLVSTNRLFILDGPSILPIVQSAYRKLNIIPSNILLHMENEPINKGNVYLGIVSGKELKNIYNEFGDALFFENIRDFLGETSGLKKETRRENVNGAITETVTKAPEKMLARNNGITFRAESVKLEDSKTLRLSNASIVNGCQTTVCLVQAPNPEEAFVIIKIVETNDSWDIAKTANFQNKVEQIELELAQFIRPQVVKNAASKLGVNVRMESGYISIFDIFQSIYQDQIAYESIYYLFIGFFSRTPNNLLSSRYTDLREDLLQSFSNQNKSNNLQLEQTFEILFNLYSLAEKGQKKLEEVYSDETQKRLFKRFWKDGGSGYNAFLTILAICSCTKTNIYNSLMDTEKMNLFLREIKFILENDTEKFLRYYSYAFQVIALNVIGEDKNEDVILQEMYQEIKRAKFNNLYTKVSVLASPNEPHF